MIITSGNCEGKLLMKDSYFTVKINITFCLPLNTLMKIILVCVFIFEGANCMK